MTAITRRALSLEQFLQLPEEEPALEFEEGTVTQKVSPKGQHSRLQSRVVDLINRFAEPNKLALAFPELRTTFARRSPVPDVAVFVWQRIPLNSVGEIANDFREPPDIAIEIVSPEQSVNGLIRRCLGFVASGVRVALLVDPADRSILDFRPNQVPIPRHGQDLIDLGDIVPGLTFSVRDVFSSLRIS
jgi:Uma2 family endonuclease